MKTRKKKPIKARFMQKVFEDSNSGCWIWTASFINSDGYGCFSENGKSRGAHRVSYELFRGEIPEGMCVLHTCDVTSCVNPEHLFLGMPRDNTNDMVQKKRHSRAGPRLNPEIVSEIRECVGKTNRGEIARTYGLSVRHLRRIANNISWVVR